MFAIQRTVHAVIISFLIYFVSLGNVAFADPDDFYWTLSRNGLGTSECLEKFSSPQAAGACVASSSVNTYPGGPDKQGCTGTYRSFIPRNSLGFGHDPYVEINLHCPSWTHSYYGIQPEFNGVRQYVTMPSAYPLTAAVSNDTPSPQCPVGNPINSSNGAKIQTEIDIDPRGIGQISFGRTYNNADTVNTQPWFHIYSKSLFVLEPQETRRLLHKSSPHVSGADPFDTTRNPRDEACRYGWSELKTKIGKSWTTNTIAAYENGICKIKKDGQLVGILPILKGGQTEVISNPGSVQLQRDTGSTLTYVYNNRGNWISTTSETGQLEKLTSDATWRFTTSNGDIEDYTAEGKLLSITASNGMKQELFYDATSGLLARVKDSTNRELLFTYTGNQLSSVTVDGNKTTSYTYNTSGLITQVIRPDNTTRIYHYEDTRFPTALTGITDERGVRYATWTYDAQGRAISSEHAGGAEKTLLAFNADGSTTVTNALNKRTIYRFDDIAGARRVTKVEGQPTTNCLDANQDYTYTSEGWIASKTDWKGIKTTFTYNIAGQEISRTEAFGTPEARTIATEWHPTLFVKTKITEPEKETVYNYDANGKLLNQSTRSLTVQ